MVFTRETLLKDFILRIKDKGSCISAQNWCEDIDEKFLQCTLSQAIDEVPQSWAVWAMVVLEDELDVEVRKMYLGRVKDPMAAFQLYLRLSSLTNEEDSILEIVFKGKLPTAEKELQEGIVVRRKDKKHG